MIVVHSLWTHILCILGEFPECKNHEINRSSNNILGTLGCCSGCHNAVQMPYIGMVGQINEQDR